MNENIINLFTEETYNAAQNTIELHNTLLSITKGDIDQVAQKILLSPIVLNIDGIHQLAFDIFMVCSLRPSQIKNIVGLVKILFENMAHDNALEELKPILVPTSIPHQRWYRSFLIQCYIDKIITIDEFMSLLRSFYDSQDLNSLSIAFCWFAPLIQATNFEVYEELERMMMDAYKSDNLFPEVAAYISQFSELQKDNWKEHLISFKSGYYKASYAYVISRDDADRLRTMLINYTKEKGDTSTLLKKDIQKKKDEEDETEEDIDDDNDHELVCNRRIMPSVFEKHSYLLSKPTLLQFAAFQGAIKCFGTLLLYNADMNLTDKSPYHRTLAEYAVAGGSPKIIQLCEKAHIDFSGCFETAVEFFRFDLLKKLISKVESEDLIQVFETVFRAAAKYNNLEALMYSLENGVDINSVDEEGRTALHFAAEKEQIDVLLTLVQLPGIMTNMYDHQGRTPLHLAAKYGKGSSIRILLIDPNLDINICDEVQMTPLHIACKNGYFNVINLLLSQENVQINMQDELGMTALHYATQKMWIASIQLLLTYPGINVNIRDRFGWTPFHIAAFNGNLEIISMFLYISDLDYYARNDVF